MAIKPRALRMLETFFTWSEQEPNENNGISIDGKGVKYFQFAEDSMAHTYLKIARDVLQDEFEARQLAPEQGAATDR